MDKGQIENGIKTNGPLGYVVGDGDASAERVFLGKELAEGTSDGKHITGAPFRRRELNFCSPLEAAEQLGREVEEMAMMFSGLVLKFKKLAALPKVADFCQQLLIFSRNFDEQIVRFEVAMSDGIVPAAQSPDRLEDLPGEINQNSFSRGAYEAGQRAGVVDHVQKSGVTSLHHDQTNILTFDAIDVLHKAFAAHKLLHQLHLFLEFLSALGSVEGDLLGGDWLGATAQVGGKDIGALSSQYFVEMHLKMGTFCGVEIPFSRLAAYIASLHWTWLKNKK